MRKSLFFAFVVIIVGSCLISCGSKEEEKPWRYDIDYTGGGSGDITFQGGSYKSCNIDSHNCTKGIDLNTDGYCDVCENNGYYCTMAKHH